MESWWSSRPPSPASTRIAPRSHRDCRVERELEIGRVLLLGMALDAGARALGDGDCLRRGGVEVPDGERDLEPERERVLEPLVRGDDRRTERRGQRRARIRRLSARHHHYDLFRHAFLRWHYPDQVLRVGGALVRPLSPAARAPRHARLIVQRIRSRGDEPAPDPAEHRPARAVPRDALGRPAARGCRRHDHARPRHRDRVGPRPRAGDLPDRRGARRSACWPAHGPLRPCSGPRREDSSSARWAAC